MHRPSARTGPATTHPTEAPAVQGPAKGRGDGATGLFTQNPADFAIKTTPKSLIISKNKLKRLKTDKVPKNAHLCKNECV